MQTDILLLAGLGNSGQGHWQWAWLKEMPNARWVEQKNWDNPKKNDWIESLNLEIVKSINPVVLVAHSLSVSLVAHWSLKPSPKVIGALLVAPSDVDSRIYTPIEVSDFAPMPLAKLPFPTILVYSGNDNYVSSERAEFFAQKWGSKVVNIGSKGHINGDSGLESWEEGKTFLNQLIKEVL